MRARNGVPRCYASPARLAQPVIGSVMALRLPGESAGGRAWSGISPSAALGAF
jgi:hypothetical protein